MEGGHINRRSVFLQKHHLGSSVSFLRHQQPFLLIYVFFKGQNGKMSVRRCMSSRIEHNDIKQV